MAAIWLEVRKGGDVVCRHPRTSLVLWIYWHDRLWLLAVAYSPQSGCDGYAGCLN